MTRSLILEAFGTFTPGESLSRTISGAERADAFYEAFDAHAQTMGWASDRPQPEVPAFWSTKRARLPQPGTYGRPLRCMGSGWH